jgi:hypothetical protein
MGAKAISYDGEMVLYVYSTIWHYPHALVGETDQCENSASLR